MVLALPTTPADRFALIIDGLCRVVAAQHARGLAGPMIILIWTKLRRAGTRFASLLARFEAGTLPASAPPRRCTAGRSAARPADPGDGGRGAEMDRGSPPQGGCSPRSRDAGPRLPRGFARLVRLAPETACGASQLQYFLSDPEVAVLLAAAPRMARALRPLCRMLGVELPRSPAFSAPARGQPDPAVGAPVPVPPFPAAASATSLEARGRAGPPRKPLAAPPRQPPDGPLTAPGRLALAQPQRADARP
jgi:hypothetical protein